MQNVLTNCGLSTVSYVMDKQTDRRARQLISRYWTQWANEPRNLCGFWHINNVCWLCV